MSKVVTTLLTFLFNWTKLLTVSFWNAIHTNDRTIFFRFFEQNWKIIILVCCIIATLADWYVRYRCRVTRRKAQADPAVDESQSSEYPSESGQQYDPSFADPEPVQQTDPYEATRRYRGYPAQEEPAEKPARGYTPQLSPRFAHTYAPSGNTRSFPAVNEDQQVYDQSCFDELPVNPADVSGSPARQPSYNSVYMHDVQNGFARPVSPEQLYSAADAPFHPGLDDEAFRAQVGLDRMPPESEPAQEFRPFASALNQQTEAPSRLRQFRRKAYDLFGLENESDHRGLEDIRSNVDMRTAFHEPVYPTNYQSPVSNENEDRS